MITNITVVKEVHQGKVPLPGGARETETANPQRDTARRRRSTDQGTEERETRGEEAGNGKTGAASWELGAGNWELGTESRDPPGVLGLTHLRPGRERWATGLHLSIFVQDVNGQPTGGGQETRGSKPAPVA